MQNLLSQLLDALRAKRTPDPSWAVALGELKSWEEKIRWILRHTSCHPQLIEDLYAFWAERDRGADGFLRRLRHARQDVITQISTEVVFDRYWTDGFRVWKSLTSVSDGVSPHLISQCWYRGASSTEWTEVWPDSRASIDLLQRGPLCRAEQCAAEVFAKYFSSNTERDAILALDLPVPPFEKLVDWR